MPRATRDNLLPAYPRSCYTQLAPRAARGTEGPSATAGLGSDHLGFQLIWPAFAAVYTNIIESYTTHPLPPVEETLLGHHRSLGSVAPPMNNGHRHSERKTSRRADWLDSPRSPASQRATSHLSHLAVPAAFIDCRKLARPPRAIADGAATHGSRCMRTTSRRMVHTRPLPLLVPHTSSHLTRPPIFSRRGACLLVLA